MTHQELWAFTSNLGSAAPDWLAFIQDSKDVAERFGLSAKTVIDSCRIRSYRPELESFSIGLRDVDIVVVTEAAYDSPFFRQLYNHASELHLTVVSGQARIVPSSRGIEV